MKRKLDNEEVKPFRSREANEDAAQIRDLLAAWAQSAIEELRCARPDMPDALDDRAADAFVQLHGWEPLIAIADMAGGDWPQRARAAALALSAGEAREDDSQAVQLLADIQAAFKVCQRRGIRRLMKRKASAEDKLSTVTLLKYLNSLEESPWGGWHSGNGLTSRDLARLLKPFGVRPKTIRMADGATQKGYELEGFSDTFSRYLTPVT
jgi:hypothetical protein